MFTNTLRTFRDQDTHVRGDGSRRVELEAETVVWNGWRILCIIEGGGLYDEAGGGL